MSQAWSSILFCNEKKITKKETQTQKSTKRIKARQVARTIEQEGCASFVGEKGL